jgi:peptide/nickel transport system ATP-binding protein
MPEPLLDIRDLKLTARTDRGTAQILRGINLSIARGRILGIVGESGSGKSSLASAIMGLQSPGLRASGAIMLNGVDLLSRKPAQMRAVRGRQLAMIFQDPMTALNPVFRVGTQLVDVMRRRYPGTSRHAALARCSDALAKVGLSDPARRLNEYPPQLSGGMRQRVMIAMALICQPDILIADEPTTALDATIEAQIVDLLIRLRNEFSGSIIFISHHLGTVARLCDDLAVMYGGHLVELGKVRETLLRPLHPYSNALVGCEVDEQPPEAPLAFIPGRVPETVESPPGCIFESRCVHAETVCGVAMPKLRPFKGDRQAACVRLEDLA